MGADGAEGTSTEAAAMERHTELYHLVGRDALAFVFGVGQTCIGQVEALVKLFGS